MLLEANMSQTIGSASSSLAAGTIFTIPALFLWGIVPPLRQVAMLALLGGILGIAAMVPLRRLLIVRSADELPYPEGTACAQVLKATTAKPAAAGAGSSSASRWAPSVKLALGGGVAPPVGAARRTCPSCRRPSSRWRSRPRCSGVGYILGYRQSAIMVAGSLISCARAHPADRAGRRRAGRAAVPRERR